MSSSSFLSDSPFSVSPHSDILCATPSSAEDAWKLVNELKNRGRVSVASKRYPESDQLYSKAMAVLLGFLDGSSDKNQRLTAELAVLYSNRSLVRLQMNDAGGALQDATAATGYDDNYLKGHWRLGQAAMALNQYEAALMAYSKALQIEPDNKALAAEIQKTRQQLRIQELELPKQEPPPAAAIDINMVNTPPITHTTHTIVDKPLPPTAGDHMNTNTHQDGAPDGFSSSDHVRGYKLVNGKKTSFFHHEQTDIEKQLIGDIAPKRIDNTTMTTAADTNTYTTSYTSTSAWNKAGTWEERDLTQVAISSLSDALSKCTFTIPHGASFAGSVARVTKLSNLVSVKDGGTMHASIATVRGKKRFIFEFTVLVFWELTLNGLQGDGGLCKGSITFPDVDGTHELGQGYDVAEYTVDRDTPPHAKFLLETFVRDGGLRTVLEQAMDQWILFLRDNY